MGKAFFGELLPHPESAHTFQSAGKPIRYVISQIRAGTIYDRMRTHMNDPDDEFSSWC
jgi:hypothetical protein